MTLYTTKTCSYCPTVKRILDHLKVDYQVVDVTDDYETRKNLEIKFNAQTVPVLVKNDDEYLVGYNQAKLFAFCK